MIKATLPSQQRSGPRSVLEVVLVVVAVAEVVEVAIATAARCLMKLRPPPPPRSFPTPSLTQTIPVSKYQLRVTNFTYK